MTLGNQELDLRQALFAEASCGAVLSALAEGVIVYAADGRVALVNPAAEALLGLSQAQLRGECPVTAGWQALRPDGTPLPADE
jgi:two-component system CheB/CheR fusion protein